MPCGIREEENTRVDLAMALRSEIRLIATSLSIWKLEMTMGSDSFTLNPREASRSRGSFARRLRHQERGSEQQWCGIPEAKRDS